MITGVRVRVRVRYQKSHLNSEIDKCMPININHNQLPC